MNIRNWLLASTVGAKRQVLPAPPTQTANDPEPFDPAKVRQALEELRGLEIAVPVRVEVSEEGWNRIVARIPVGVRTKYSEATDFLGLELRKVGGQDLAEVVYSDGSRRPLDREDGFS